MSTQVFIKEKAPGKKMRVWEFNELLGGDYITNSYALEHTFNGKFVSVNWENVLDEYVDFIKENADKDLVVRGSCFGDVDCQESYEAAEMIKRLIALEEDGGSAKMCVSY